MAIPLPLLGCWQMTSPRTGEREWLRLNEDGTMVHHVSTGAAPAQVMMRLRLEPLGADLFRVRPALPSLDPGWVVGLSKAGEALVIDRPGHGKSFIATRPRAAPPTE